MKLNLVMDAESGIFCAVDEGYMLATVDLKAGTVLTEFNKLAVGGMFAIYVCFIDSVRVGFYFTTPFTCENRGGYLVTYMAQRKQASEVETMIRTDELVVYDYPNCGTLAISPSMSDDLVTIFEEQ